MEYLNETSKLFHRYVPQLNKKTNNGGEDGCFYILNVLIPEIETGTTYFILLFGNL